LFWDKLPVKRESKFSTDLLPVEKRFDVWRESIAVLYDVNQDKRAAADSFHASVHGFLLDELMIARCRTSAQTFRRTPLHIAQDGVDHFMIQLFMEGGQTVRHGSREFECRAGDIVVNDLASEHHADTSPFDNLSVIVPRRVLEPLLLNADSQHGRILQADNPLIKMLSRHMRDLYELSGAMDDGQRKSLSGVTTSLIAATLNGAGIEGKRDEHAGVISSALLQVKRVIDERIHERGLNASDIAHSAGVSRAALYRLFEPYDGVMSYVRRRRLTGALRSLMNRDQSHWSITGIAFHWGFASEAHFSRAFRKQFGMSPSDARNHDHPVTEQTFDTLCDERVGDRHYETWISETLHY